MKIKKIIGSLLLLTLPVAVLNAAADNRSDQKAAKYAPDNTGINVRDRDPSRLTADDQSSSGKDTELAAKVRASLVSEDSLSVLAQNIKVIAQAGVVTLRGPVKSAEEKKIIEDKAVKIAGLDNVRNELEIKKNN